MMKVNTWETIITMIRIVWYTVTHPLWAWRVYRGYKQYSQNGGDFLDTDFYKVTMGFFVWRLFPNIGVRYQLKIRTGIEFPDGFHNTLREFVDNHAKNNTHISKEQAHWLKNLPFIKEIPARDDFERYVDFLANKHAPKMRAKDVKIKQTGSQLEAWVVGPWINTIWWEIPIMAGISELYYKAIGKQPKGFAWIAKAAKKGQILKAAGALFSEFGSRRRHSFHVQFMVDYAFITTGSTKKAGDKGGLLGTSNVFLAYLFGLTPIGTMAHELFLVLGAVFGYELANPLVVYLWRFLFGDQLGYFLPDTYTSKRAFKTLTAKDLRSFTGMRQDSGDPKEFTDWVVDLAERLGLSEEEIAQLVIIYSDSLNVAKVLELLAYALKKKIRAAFGLGTDLTNDFKEELGVGHLNIVMKPFEAWVIGDEEDTRGCVKISDQPFSRTDRGKITGDGDAAEQVIHWLDTEEITWKPLLTLQDQANRYDNFPVIDLMAA